MRKLVVFFVEQEARLCRGKVVSIFAVNYFSTDRQAGRQTDERWTKGERERACINNKGQRDSAVFIIITYLLL